VDVVVSQEGVASVDVYFLSDTTASMGTIPAAVQKNVPNILTDLGTAAADVQYGIAGGWGTLWLCSRTVPCAPGGGTIRASQETAAVHGETRR